MIKADKEEIKDMLNSSIELYLAKEKGSHDIINMKLDAITTQTTKTNGRVNKCEINVRELQDTNLSTSSIKKWMYKTVTVSSVIVSMVWIYVQILEKLIVN